MSYRSNCLRGSGFQPRVALPVKHRAKMALPPEIETPVGAPMGRSYVFVQRASQPPSTGMTAPLT